ncbi:TrkH family potassium uptake protein [uncultured Streptococcus sp.]|uniref:TrkH family potassium uptake protein n=1 Tax=uncultured Streptococcus sp. TaxID=83427 RepID=UPI0026743E79|nr:potassium transporter TrkG [uncultured Streptococcus sp.]
MINRFSVTQRLVLSFVFVILVGSNLLSLPISHYANSPETNYLDHLFNTVSMVCVTGLSVVPVSKAYNGFGQIVSMLLMQTGGLGLVSLIAISTYSLKNKLGLSDQDLLQSALSRDNQKDLKSYLFKVYKITFSIEALAALVIMTDFIPRFGLGHGIFNSLFLAVSAFCNAGFDNLGANSLQDYATNPTINLAVAGLIMSGSLGFAVWIDLIQLLRRYIKDRPRNWNLACRPLSNQSRLVLISTACILLVGTLLAWLLEMDNAKTIGSLNVWQQLMVSFFQTVTMRTAGFATISYTKADFSTNLLFMIQMIIGGGPGGTAGGIKVTTASIMFLLFKSELSGNSSVVFRNRIISNKTVLQAFTVILFFLTMLFVGYVILLETNPNLSPLALLFESVSAIATVGVSMDLTPSLNTIGRFVIMALMFIGRVGPITVLLSLMTKKEKQVSYSPTDISVG